MNNPVWQAALKSCADPERAKRHLNLLAETTALPALEKASPDQAKILCALFSGSQALSAVLIAHPDWLVALTPENLQFPRREQGLRREVDGWLKPLLKIADQSSAHIRLRQFKQREMLRIAARDLARLGTPGEILREISDVADICLDAVWQLCQQQFIECFGRPYHQDAEGRWHASEFCVLGLGKLGGQELNYSSDVDVIFVYSAAGTVFKEPPTRSQQSGLGPSSHQYFNRLAEAFIAEVSRMTPDGRLYRIDLRLRPEGDAGPLARSLAGYENYYAQWGQTWERMMLIKARHVAGDAALAHEFLEMIQPFRYPRSLGEGVVREVAAIKERIENEVVKAGELERNVKLGRGGIREIEFVAQTLQLLNGGRIPFLQGAQTLPALDKMREYQLLPAEDARSLAEAYAFLRDVEHRLQMEDDLQTHTIPAQPECRERLAALMSFRGWNEFEAARAKHSANVRGVYDRLLKSAARGPDTGLPRKFVGAEAEWKSLLAEHSFENVDHSFRVLNEFVHGPGYVHVSNRTTDLALQLLPKLFALCPKPARKSARSPIPAVGESLEGGTSKSHGPPLKILSDPDRVLTRLDNFIAAYGARATLFETWNRTPSIFELLLLLFDRSEFLAEAAIHVPDLVDDLVVSGRLRQRKTAQQTLKDLRHGRSDADQHLWLRQYHQVELMRIGLRDILGLADFEQNLAELSGLAEACLQYALEVVLRKNKIKTQPLAIIGLGKLGGGEVNYGSDLDVIFVTDAKAKGLPKLQRLAVEIMDLLRARTDQGIVFPMDARLRPDGEKGLLVNTLEAHEEYYRHRAGLWEIQALSRARAVAGNVELGKRFQDLAQLLANFTPENVASNFGARPKEPQNGRARQRRSKPAARQTGLAAYAPDWKKKIHKMRQRIEKERTPLGQDALAIKTGSGGLMDAEFAAQALCLANGWHEPNTLRALQRARDAKILSPTDAEQFIENYRQLRRIEGILRRWSFEGETVLPAEDAPFYRVSIRCGFSTPKEFRQALRKLRRQMRKVYSKVL